MPRSSVRGNRDEQLRASGNSGLPDASGKFLQSSISRMLFIRCFNGGKNLGAMGLNGFHVPLLHDLSVRRNQEGDALRVLHGPERMD
jgi:hypothetical protein